MADGRWRITVTPPDWGQDHLSLEAIAAYVDGELASGPHARAAQHLGQCPDCASQVSMQGQARKELRGAGGPCLPSALLSTLRAIPQDTDLPGPPPGLAMTADGQLVSVVRPEPRRAPEFGGHPFRAEVRAPAHHSPRPGRPAPHRRLRVGTGIAVSGLAVGALVFGVSDTVPSAPAAPGGTPTPAAQRSGSVLGELNRSPSEIDAQLRLGTTGPGPAAPPVFER